MQTAVFCGVVGVLAGAVAIVEILASTRDHYEALRTREVHQLYVVNVVLAGVLAYVLVSVTAGFNIGILSAIGIVLGYPLLLHTKLFNFKDTSWGFEEIYLRVSDMLRPRIDDSIDERGTAYLAEFRDIPTRQLARHAKDYLRIKLPRTDLPDQRKATLLDLMDRLLADSEANPAREGENNSLIFETLNEIGGYRAVRHVKRVATKA